MSIAGAEEDLRRVRPSRPRIALALAPPHNPEEQEGSSS
jgi:hypothetical protein